MKYRLLKDLPGYKAGQVFRHTDTDGWLEDDRPTISRYVDMLLSVTPDPDWFEPIKEAEKSNYTIVVYPSLDRNHPVHEWVDSYTEAQAEAVSEAIKALLEYVHDPKEREDYDGKMPIPANVFCIKAAEAHMAVQGEA